MIVHNSSEQPLCIKLLLFYKCSTWNFVLVPPISGVRCVIVDGSKHVEELSDRLFLNPFDIVFRTPIRKFSINFLFFGSSSNIPVVALKLFGAPSCSRTSALLHSTSGSRKAFIERCEFRNILQGQSGIFPVVRAIVSQIIFYRTHLSI